MKKYTVRRGQFDFSFDFGIHFGTTSETYFFRLEESCWYEKSEIGGEDDWDKLAGWSYGFLPVRRESHFTVKADFTLLGREYVWAHHYSSARLVWRPILIHENYESYLNGLKPSRKAFEIAAYVYDKGVRQVYKGVFSATPGEDSFESIEITKSGGLTIGILSYGYGKFNSKPTWGYRLYPYFGGNHPAPHDMTLYLERKK